MLSRLLGLVREQVMAGFFGAGFSTDAFNVAFRIPNLLRDLFAEGAMSSAFVPTFTAVLTHRGEKDAWAFGRQLMITLALVLLGIVVIGWIAAPLIVHLFAPGFEAVPGKHELTVLLTRIMLPFLPAVALAAACMGMLNARGRFGVPALAPAWLNLGMIVIGVGLIPVFKKFGQPPILAMAIGVVVGGTAQFLFQLPLLGKLGFHLRLERPRRDPDVARVARLMTPATIGLAATQFNLFFSTLLASLLVQGSVSWLWYAFRVMQLPIGVFGVALATVSLPALSRAAVANDVPLLRNTLSATLRLVFLLTVPSALWLAAMAQPVISLLYQHGHFTATDTSRTAAALTMYCIGLPAFAAVGVFTRAFYALGDTKTPVKVTFISVALNVTLNLILMRPLGHVGLALATAMTSIASLTQLAWLLRRRVGLIDGRRIATSALRVLLAGGIVAAGIAIGLAALGEWWRIAFSHKIVVVFGAFVLSAGAGVLLLRAFRVNELDALAELGRALARRWRPGVPGEGPGGDD